MVLICGVGVPLLVSGLFTKVTGQHVIVESNPYLHEGRKAFIE
jgi:hypothetical protein